MINPPGQAQEKVSASDKELKQILQSIFFVATFWLEEQVDAFNPGSSMRRQYANEQTAKNVIKAFIESEDEKDKDHLGFMMKLFGYESIIKREEFLRDMTNKFKWFFTSKGIRD